MGQPVVMKLPLSHFLLLCFACAAGIGLLGTTPSQPPSNAGQMFSLVVRFLGGLTALTICTRYVAMLTPVRVRRFVVWMIVLGFVAIIVLLVLVASLTPMYLL
jgi:hypothetical protein